MKEQEVLQGMFSIRKSHQEVLVEEDPLMIILGKWTKKMGHSHFLPVNL